MDLNEAQIGPYQVGKEIGRGPVAVVYRAFDTLYEREVALKVLPPYFAHDPDLVRRFISAGREAARLRHPNILTVYDAGHADGHNYVALELVDGGTLADKIGAGQPLADQAQILDIAGQTAAGLDYAHARNILHLNLKPSNILFAADGRALLADFGAVRGDSSVGAGPSAADAVAYLSPEQARGEGQPDARSDIYGLGALLFLTSAGRPPFSAENPIVLLRKIIDDPAPHLDALDPSLPATFSLAVDAALSKEPEQRPESAGALVKLLDTPTAVEAPTAAPPATPEVQAADDEMKVSWQVPDTWPDPDEDVEFQEVDRQRRPGWVTGLGLLAIVAVILALAAVLRGADLLPARFSNETPTPNAVGAVETAPTLDAATPVPTPTTEPTATSVITTGSGLPVVVFAPTTDDETTPVAPANGATAEPDEESPDGGQSGDSFALAEVTDPNRRFTLHAPAGWRQEQTGDLTRFVSADPVAEFRVAPIPEVASDESLRAIAERYIVDNWSDGSQSPEFDEIVRGDGDVGRVGGLRAYEEWLTASNTNGELVVLRLIIVKQSERAYALLTVADPLQVNALRPMLDAVADSFTPFDQPTQIAGASAPAAVERTATSEAPTATPEATVTSAPSATPESTVTPTPSATPTTVSLAPGVVTDFEDWGVWARGDEAWGTFTQSGEETQSGEAAGKFDYSFPADAPEGRNFIVFRRTLPIGASAQDTDANALRLWVHGDGSGSYLNAWVQDAETRLWQFTFGQVTHSGWQQMTAPFDLTGGWPNQLIGSQSTDAEPTLPLRLHALVVDGYPEDVAHEGVIYVDDLTAVALSPGELTLAAVQAISGTAALSATIAAIPTPSGRIAYAVKNPRSDRMDLYIYSIENDLSWPQIPNRRQPDFGPTGELVVNGEGGDVDNLVRMGPAGENPWVISEHPEDAHAQWSPNGKSIVFDSTFVGDDRHRLYFQEDASDRQPVVPMMYEAWELFGRYPVFLDDGRIAYQGCNVWENGGVCGLYLADTAGRRPTNITGYPRDIPTGNLGNQVLFMSDREGVWDIYAVNADGGNLRQLTTGPGNDGLATTSPDGNFIAFVTDRDERWSIYVMNVDGSGQRKLFDLDGGYGGDHQAWSEERLSWSR